MGANAQGDVQHRLGCGHFKIKRLADRGLQPAHVIVVNVAAILAQMSGDAIGPGFNRHKRRAHRIGDSAAARVSDSRDMVHIHAQSKRCHR